MNIILTCEYFTVEFVYALIGIKLFVSNFPQTSYRSSFFDNHFYYVFTQMPLKGLILIYDHQSQYFKICAPNKDVPK